MNKETDEILSLCRTTLRQNCIDLTKAYAKFITNQVYAFDNIIEENELNFSFIDLKDSLFEDKEVKVKDIIFYIQNKSDLNALESLQSRLEAKIYENLSLNTNYYAYIDSIYDIESDLPPF